MSPIPIPYGESYNVTITGQTPKLVRCEECQYEYVYLLETSRTGSGTSLLFMDTAGAQERARGSAELAVQAALQTECAVVPCPSCGHIQQHMVPLSRKQRYQWMGTSALYSFIGGGLLILPAVIVCSVAGSPRAEADTTLFAWVLWICITGLLVGAISLVLVRLFLARRFDPHIQPVELRKMWGQALAVSKEEYLQIMQAKRGQ